MLKKLRAQVVNRKMENSFKKVKCFIKNEAYATFKNPRAILARVDEFKVRIGPFIRAVEETVYSLRDDNNNKYFIKTVPVPERAKLICEVIGTATGHNDPECKNEHLQRYLVTDYSQYEASFDAIIMDACEFKLYRWIYNILRPEDFDFTDLECIMQDNFCSFKHFIVKIKSRRMSGEMNTSVGNGFTNLMLTKFQLWRYGCTNIRMFVEGDDCLVSYIGPMFDDTIARRLGFRVKMQYFNHPNHASFCGQIFDHHHLRVITDPIKIILNFPWFSMIYRHRPTTWKGLSRAKALSLLYQYPGCPIIQPFAERVLSLTFGVEAIVDMSAEPYTRQLLQSAIVAERICVPIEYATRELMAELFNISITNQLLLERFFSYLDYGPYRCPIIMQYVSQDMKYFYSKYVVEPTY